MRNFRFYPPSPEEQRAFFAQLLGTILSLGLIGVLAWRNSDANLRGVLIGAVMGVLFLVARSAWLLEKKAARAQNGEINVEENGFSIVDARGQRQWVEWDEIEQTEVRGGRLHVAWHGGEMTIGAREIENGMELIQLLASRGESIPASDGAFAPPSNFIPLEPNSNQHTSNEH